MLFKASCAPVLTRWVGPLLSRTHIRLNGCAQSMHTCPEAAQKNGRLPKKQARVRTFPMERARFFGQLPKILGSDTLVDLGDDSGFFFRQLSIITENNRIWHDDCFKGELMIEQGGQRQVPKM